MNQAIETAISIIGNKNRLSKAVGVSSVAVQKWREGGGLSVVYSPRYFKRSIATLKGFPAPIVLPTAARGGDERYEPKEVKEWARRQRK